MVKSIVISAAAVIAATLISSSSSSPSLLTTLAEARPSCEHCLSTGRAYFCKASITSHICFDGGDAQCDHEFCVCCKDQPQGGCMACEELDEEEWQEENLEQIDEWQSHEMRQRIKDEKDASTASRNAEIGITGGLTPEKLEAKHQRREQKREEAKKKAEEAKKERAEKEAAEAADSENAENADPVEDVQSDHQEEL